MTPLNGAYTRSEIGMAILSGVDSLPHPYVLFDHKGRLKYGNPQFFNMFVEVAEDDDVFALLRDKLGIDDFPRMCSEEEIESLCSGGPHLRGFDRDIPHSGCSPSFSQSLGGAPVLAEANESKFIADSR